MCVCVNNLFCVFGFVFVFWFCFGVGGCFLKCTHSVWSKNKKTKDPVHTGGDIQLFQREHALSVSCSL